MYETVEDTGKYFSSLPQGKLCEWGVFNGNTLRRLIETAQKNSYKFDEVYGFDVFKGGLPPETPGVFNNPDWPKGAFDVSVDYNLQSVEEAIEFVRKRVGYPVTYIAGYFEQSLTEKVAGQIEMQSVSYAHVDCDIHSSSKQVLYFIFRHRLLAEGGIIRFDDICSTPENGGQKLALTQTVAKFNPTLLQLSDNVFQLLSYGDK